MAEMINAEGLVRVVAGVSDILVRFSRAASPSVPLTDPSCARQDCGVVLNAQIPKVDLLVRCGDFDARSSMRPRTTG